MPPCRTFGFIIQKHACHLVGRTGDSERSETRNACVAAEVGATKAMGSKDSPWLAAVALDRWLMYQGKPQKYGTQFVPGGKRWRLWDIDPSTTDAERAANHVPSLQEQLQQAERSTQELGQPPGEKAPQWMKEALERWQREDA